MLYDLFMAIHKNKAKYTGYFNEFYYIATKKCCGGEMVN